MAERFTLVLGHIGPSVVDIVRSSELAILIEIHVLRWHVGVLSVVIDVVVVGFADSGASSGRVGVRALSGSVVAPHFGGILGV